MTLTSNEQHGKELEKNRVAWNRKSLLRAVYYNFYRRIATKLVSGKGVNTLELGSGVGAVKEVIPCCMTSELFSVEGIDRVENAYALNFEKESLDNIILFDVFHHLQFVGNVLDEFKRVLKPKGRVVLFEPDMSLAGRLVYGLFHPEPLGLRCAMSWHAPSDFDPRKTTYYAAQGNAWRLFVRQEWKEKWAVDWNLVGVERLSAFAYWGTGGFSGSQRYPDQWLVGVQKLDAAFQKMPSLFSGRLLVTLEKKI